MAMNAVINVSLPIVTLLGFYAVVWLLSRMLNRRRPPSAPIPTVSETAADRARRAAKWEREDLEQEIRQAVEVDLKKRQ